MDELFDLVGYEGLYKITKGGDLFSCKKNRFMSFQVDKDGYNVTEICKNKKAKKISRHRLLALQFIPNDDTVNKIQVDHIDRNKSNNSLDNLRWVTPSQNIRNRDRYGIVRQVNIIDRRRGNNTERIYFQASVCYYDENGNRIILKKKNKDKEVVKKWLEETRLLYPV
jgi:CRISPR/Cas system CSM-associated protein Csm4 (group 5 of RAMP superfamily)